MDQINAKATFRDDLFSRKAYAQFAMQLIQFHPANRGACSIAVDAPWGVGKSTFLHMWINELDLGNPRFTAWQEFDPPYVSEFSGKQILPILYNAWENDYCDNALASLLFSVCAQMEKRQKEGLFLPDASEKIISFISVCAQLAASLIAATSTSPHPLLDVAASSAGTVSKGILGLLSRYIGSKQSPPPEEQISAAYDKQCEIRTSFSDALLTLTKESDGVIIFIDELDRCKPSFAIDILEAIKHYFNIPGITFVFAVDMRELAHAVGGRYGQKMNASGYLAKFFDYQMVLPTPTAEQMIAKNLEIIPQFDSGLIACIQDLFSACEISPREVPLLLQRAHIIWKKHFDIIHCKFSHAPYLFVLSLLCMKAKQPERYWCYINGTGTWDEGNWRGKHMVAHQYLSPISQAVEKTAQSILDTAQATIGSVRSYDASEDVKAMTWVRYVLAQTIDPHAPFRDAIHNMIELPLSDASIIEH